MADSTVGLVSDLDWTEGIGRFGVQLQRLLGVEFNIELAYFNYAGRSLEITRAGVTRRAVRTVRIPLVDNKPWFWQRVRNSLPRYDLTHYISQNLSFLTPRDGRAVVTCHDIAPLFIPGKPWVKWARRRLYSGLARAQVVTADSHSTASDIARAFGRPEQNVRVIPLGVDLDLFRPRDRAECRRRLGLPADRPLVLHLGIDKWRKNVAGVLRAFGFLLKRLPDALLVRVGGLSRGNARLASELGLGLNLRVLSFCNDGMLADCYSAADALVFPSFYEGFGLPPLEAMACGTPVVASNTTSLPEVVGDAGLQVDPASPELTAEALSRVLTDESLSHALSEAGRKRAAGFSWGRTAAAVRTEYRRFLETG
jgi:glycosyltransferase involved in cell wall biosynthesis